MTARKAKAAVEQSESDEAPQVRPPEVFVPRKKAAPPEGMYPEGMELFSYTSKTTGETFWMPTKFQQPTAVQVWELYDKPWNVQSWAWMKWAAVPRAMQRQIVGLMDVSPDEYLDMFNQWFKVTGGAKAGE